MPTNRTGISGSWFRGRGGKRFGLEFGLVIAIKLVLLILLWAFVIRPLPRADTSPAAIERHFSPPASTETSR